MSVVDECQVIDQSADLYGSELQLQHQHGRPSGRPHVKPVIAGIWAELLLIAIRVPLVKYFDPIPLPVGVVLWIVPMFPGGLWVSQRGAFYNQGTGGGL